MHWRASRVLSVLGGGGREWSVGVGNLDINLECCGGHTEPLFLT